MVSIKNKKVNDFIAGLVTSEQTIWIGASRSQMNQKEFQWTDASKWSWSLFGNRQPAYSSAKEACILLYFPQKKWKFAPCSSKYPLVCQTGGKMNVSFLKVVSINLQDHTSLLLSPYILTGLPLCSFKVDHSFDI